MQDKAEIVKKLNEWSEEAGNNLGTGARYAFIEEFKPYGLLDKFFL